MIFRKPAQRMTSGLPGGQFVSTGATCSIFRCRMRDIYLASYQARRLIFMIPPGYGRG
jgi:hypothetical protein